MGSGSGWNGALHSGTLFRRPAFIHEYGAACGAEPPQQVPLEVLVETLSRILSDSQAHRNLRGWTRESERRDVRVSILHAQGFVSPACRKHRQRIAAFTTIAAAIEEE